MISRRTESFKKLLDALPIEVQRQARDAYKYWMHNPNHPSLHFKKLYEKREIWSVRITEDYRAVGAKSGDRMLWFWVGKHAEYDRLIRKLRKKKTKRESQ